MAQEVRLDKDSTELDIAKPEANLVHTKPFTCGRGTFSSPYYPSSASTSHSTMYRGHYPTHGPPGAFSANHPPLGFGPNLNQV
uniref:Uncharacterized protein n=1 Tax=Cannabis sativa TaxID=3483 RepID=A0A803PUS9_CANSA